MLVPEKKINSKKSLTERLKYPLIRGDTVVFDVSNSSACVKESSRPVVPLLLEKVTESEYDWLCKNAKGRVYISTCRGSSEQEYNLIRNPKTSEVAMKWQKILVRSPLDLITDYFYDAVTKEIQRLRSALESHRKGLQTGWGDAIIYGEYTSK